MFPARGAGFRLNTESAGIRHPFFERLGHYALALGDAAHLPAAAFCMIAVVAAGSVMATHPRFGLRLLAFVGHEAVALLLSWAVGPAKMAVEAPNGFCAALAGIVATCSTGSGNPSLGLGLELAAIAVVVSGGTGLVGGRGHGVGTSLGGGE